MMAISSLAVTSVVLLLGLPAATSSPNECVASNENPEEWEAWSIDDFWDKLECEALFESPRPVHNDSTWMMLRGTYQGIVVPSESSIAPLTYSHGFFVDFQVMQSPGKGRGVYAAQDVAKGSLIWNTRNTARFRDGPSYRKFLASIPPDLSCDVIQWAYVQNVALGYDGQKISDDAEDKLLVSVDLDPGICVNSARSYDSDTTPAQLEEEEFQNMGCVPEAAKELPGGCNENYFAVRDIEAGDEFLLAYGDFAITDGWKEFGLQ